jgi:hypothetical protein
MYTQKSTQEHINRLTEFRQAIYSQAFSQRRDAQFEVVDALLLKGRVSSWPWLATAGCFRRKWPSLYDALEAGRQEGAWLQAYLAHQVPAVGLQYYALDASAWGRPAGETLAERHYVYQPGRNLNGKPVVAGYAYSLLDWIPATGQSWSLSVEVTRVPSTETDLSVGVSQVKRLCEARADLVEGLDIVAGDCKYSSLKFLRGVQGQRCGIIVRGRKDRVLYRTPPSPLKRPRGRPRQHGDRFVFKDPATWGQPTEVICRDHPKWGRVELRRWPNLHGKAGADVVFDVVQARVHLERDKPPAPLWLFWLPPPLIPPPLVVTAETIWNGYDHRWPIEPGIRFRKQQLLWTTPQFQTAEAGDRCTVLVNLAVWQLYLARPIAQDCPLPWQPRQTQLTPARVRQGWPDIFAQIGTPARPPRTRGKSPGWLVGQPRQPRKRYAVVKKQAKQVKKRTKTLSATPIPA